MAPVKRSKVVIAGNLVPFTQLSIPVYHPTPEHLTPKEGVEWVGLMISMFHSPSQSLPRAISLMYSCSIERAGLEEKTKNYKINKRGKKASTTDE